MKILQIIDSLSLGGSERMAVTMANAFTREGHESLLIATRTEGILKSQISSSVRYWFLNKLTSYDIISLIRLVRIINQERPDVVHAHSTSVFWSMLVKLFLPWVKVIWHHHLGLSNLVKAKPRPLIIFLSRWFYGAVMVNERLFNWAILELKCDRSRICYLENFSDMQIINRDKPEFTSNGLRILHLANFREQKDHINLVKSLLLLKNRGVQFKAYLVGAHIDQVIANRVQVFIKENELSDQVKVTGPSDDIGKYAMQCNVGVLSSFSEGYPVSLIEYGSFGLYIVTTNAGQCEAILGKDKYGTVVPVGNPMAFADTLQSVSNDLASAYERSTAFQLHLQSKNAAKQFMDAYITTYLNWQLR